MFVKSDWIGEGLDGGTRIGSARLFGIDVDNANHPHRWTVVCLVGFLLAGLVVANLRRSRTGRRLIAVRTNERAAASLGISVFGVKLYAFSVAAAIAGLGGVLLGFRSTVITYEQYSPLQSIFSVGWAVIGGLGFAIGAVFSAPNAIGGLGTRIFDDVLGVGEWDVLVGGLILLVIIVVHQDGIAEYVTHALRPLFRRLRLVARVREEAPLQVLPPEPVPPAALTVADLTVRFGGVVAVDDVSFDVQPGEVVGLIGPNGAGKTTIIDAVTGFVKPTPGADEPRRQSDHEMVAGQASPQRVASFVPVPRAVRRRERRGEHPRRRRRPHAGVVAHRSVLARPSRSALDRGLGDPGVRARSAPPPEPRRAPVRTPAPGRASRARSHRDRR